MPAISVMIFFKISHSILAWQSCSGTLSNYTRISSQKSILGIVFACRSVRLGLISGDLRARCRALCGGWFAGGFVPGLGEVTAREWVLDRVACHATVYAHAIATACIGARKGHVPRPAVIVPLHALR